MNETPRKTTVTLEDLLRLKRAERPPAEFWDEFERGMRTKQLAAIVEPRPWWAPFIKVSSKIVRYQLPVGAAAILAVTFVSLREYRSVESRPLNEPAVAAVTLAAPALPTPTPASVNAEAKSSAAVSAPMVIAEMPSPVAAPVNPAPVDVPAQATALVGATSHVVPVQTELAGSSRYIADSLESARSADTELDQMLGRSIRSLENRPARSEPLTHVSMPGATRRSRLLAGTAWLASASTSGDSALRTDSESVRRLTERRLSESDAVSRIDVGGDRFTVKF